MHVSFDHVAILCSDLAAAREWLEYVIGAPMSARGVHRRMGTHNHLLSLGGDSYLELIAIDPDATPPQGARWFGLDDFTGDARPGSWILRTEDMEAARALAPPGVGTPLDLARDSYRWRITVPESGHQPFDDLFPALIEWQGPHPAAALPDHGVRLEVLYLSHPRPDALRAAIETLGDPGIEMHIARGAVPRLGFELSTPRGRKAF